LQHLGKNNFRNPDFKTRRKIAKRQRDEESKSKLEKNKIKIESRFQINEPREYSDQNKNTPSTSATTVHQEENDNDKFIVSNSAFGYDIDPEKKGHIPFMACSLEEDRSDLNGTWTMLVIVFRLRDVMEKASKRSNADELMRETKQRLSSLMVHWS
jgi:hypothetical protein